MSALKLVLSLSLSIFHRNPFLLFRLLPKFGKVFMTQCFVKVDNPFPAISPGRNISESLTTLNSYEVGGKRWTRFLEKKTFFK